MKLFLHACCAPCAIYPIKTAKKDGYDSITGFFYNPNIHLEGEFKKRLSETKKVFDSYKLDLIIPEYKSREYFECISDCENKEKKRCFDCWRLRLDKTVSVAKEEGFDAFTTTLLVSPYQDHDVLKDSAKALAEKYGIDFYYKDFRTGFKDAHNEAKREGIYCQNYCGCVFSIVEREERRKERKKKKVKS